MVDLISKRERDGGEDSGNKKIKHEAKPPKWKLVRWFAIANVEKLVLVVGVFLLGREDMQWQSVWLIGLFEDEQLCQVTSNRKPRAVAKEPMLLRSTPRAVFCIPTRRERTAYGRKITCF